jgi:hypothetical protein
MCAAVHALQDDIGPKKYDQNAVKMFKVWIGIDTMGLDSSPWLVSSWDKALAFWHLQQACNESMHRSNCLA